MIPLAFAAGVTLGLWLGVDFAVNLVRAMNSNLAQLQHQAAELDAVDPLASMEEVQP